MSETVAVEQLVDHLRASRARSLALVEGLSDEQLMGPRLDIVNPLLWEIGHVAWFHEVFTLRKLDGREPLIAGADALYDSMAIPHDARWDLPLPSLADTLAYMEHVQEAMIARLGEGPVSSREAYLYRLTAFHEDMHDEAFTYTRQTLAYPRPGWPGIAEPASGGAGPLEGDISVPGGAFMLGATGAGGFYFDNEKWAHEVRLEPFRIARAPVTNAQFARFVEDGGYLGPELWDDEGWAWREAAGLEAPVYWRRAPHGWEQRRFERFEPLAPHAPVMHVSWHEARAYCRWAGRRLPTEAEWEMAASCEPTAGVRMPTRRKRLYPWGEAPPGARHANLDGRRLGPLDVGALAAGDSAFGCRQMLGNVWEWTASPFEPYPGFSPDVYVEYSAPWFGTRKVLRGGSWVTPARMMWNTWRNFFPPGRNDIFAGFRTCAL